MIESNVKSLILLTTGRRKDLVYWEIKNQADYAGIPLLSFTSISSRSTTLSTDDALISTSDNHGKEQSSENVVRLDNIKFKEVLFRARFSCSASDIDVLKNILGNCILLRSAYEETIAEAIGTDQLWAFLAEKDLVSSVTSKSYRSEMWSYPTYATSPVFSPLETLALVSQLHVFSSLLHL